MMLGISPFTSSLKDSSNFRMVWPYSEKIVGMKMGLGQRSPFALLEDSGKFV